MWSPGRVRICSRNRPTSLEHNRQKRCGWEVQETDTKGLWRNGYRKVQHGADSRRALEHLGELVAFIQPVALEAKQHVALHSCGRGWTRTSKGWRPIIGGGWFAEAELTIVGPHKILGLKGGRGELLAPRRDVHEEGACLLYNGNELLDDRRAETLEHVRGLLHWLAERGRHQLLKQGKQDLRPGG